MSTQAQTNIAPGHRERIRKKLFIEATVLEDYELLELLLGYVLRRKDTKGLAKELLRTFGNIRGVLDAQSLELHSIEGIGPGVINMWLLLHELRARYAESPVRARIHLCTPQTVAIMAKARLSGHADEEMWLALVDNQNRLQKWLCLNKGTVNGVLFYPREVIRLAIENKAWGFFLVHNHPGGSHTPSAADLECTARLHDTAQSLDIHLLDHVIVTDTTCYSIRESSLVDFENTPIEHPQRQVP